jgi:hypothetical protein
MRFVAIALLAACGAPASKPAPAPPQKTQPTSTCADVERSLAITVTALAASGGHPLGPDERDELARFLHDLAKHCTDDAWSRASVECFATAKTAEAFDGCLHGLTPPQRASLDKMQKLQGRTLPPSELAKHEVQQYAFEAYPQWAVANPSKACPASIAELNEYTTRKDDLDPWGHPYKLMCGPTLPPGAKGVAVASAGPDGQFDTGDDVRSWDM